MAIALSTTALRATWKTTKHYATRALGLGVKTPWEASFRSEVVSGESRVKAQLPFFWQSYIPRIRGAEAYSAEYVIEKDFNRESVIFSPVTAHWIRDAFVVDGSVFLPGYRQELRNGFAKRGISVLPKAPIYEFDSAALVSLKWGSMWWGHWLPDQLPYE